MNEMIQQNNEIQNEINNIKFKLKLLDSEYDNVRTKINNANHEMNIINDEFTKIFETYSRIITIAKSK